MQVVQGRPPIYDRALAAFPIAGKGVIFAWGWTVYNPFAIVVSPQLLAHEGVHCHRQESGGPEKWWDRYIEDAEFRLEEEIPAHIAEFKDICTRVKDRNSCAVALHRISARLSSPMYGNLIAHAAARKLIQDAQ